MGRNIKFDQKLKLKMVKEYLNKGIPAKALSKKYGCDAIYIRFLAKKYQNHGAKALLVSQNNQSYTTDFKHMVVKEYMKGQKSLRSLAIEYNINSSSIIHTWKKMYNGHKELNSYNSYGGKNMTKGRKISYEERIDIIEDYLKNGKSYAATANKYNLSYQQIYTLVRKYNVFGIKSLPDHSDKPNNIEDMGQIKKLEAENKILKARLERLEIELELKKKLKELQMNLELSIKKKK